MVAPRAVLCDMLGKGPWEGQSKVIWLRKLNHTSRSTSMPLLLGSPQKALSALSALSTASGPLPGYLLSTSWHHGNSMSLVANDRNLLDRDHFLGTCVCYSSCVMLLCATYTPSGPRRFSLQLLVVWQLMGYDLSSSLEIVLFGRELPHPRSSPHPKTSRYGGTRTQPFASVGTT